MKRSIRVGVIGAGQIVENAHLPVLLNVPGIQVRWIGDTNEHRAALLGSMYRVPPRRLESLDRLFDDVDACLIAIPVGARSRYFEACASRGVAVLAEKPFALSVAAHRALCERFTQHGLGVCLQRRFYASVRAIRSVVARQLFGSLESVSFGIGGLDLKSGGPNRYLGDPKLSGGGIVIELGVHLLDQVLVASGASAVVVDSVRSIQLDGIDYEATIDATLRTDTGPVSVRGEMTRLRPVASGFVFAFERATVRFGPGPDATLSAVAREGGPTFRIDSPEGGATSVAEAFFALWTEFVHGLEKEECSSASACTALLTAAWVEQIYEKMGRAA